MKKLATKRLSSKICTYCQYFLSLTEVCASTITEGLLDRGLRGLKLPPPQEFFGSKKRTDIRICRQSITISPPGFNIPTGLYTMRACKRTGIGWLIRLFTFLFPPLFNKAAFLTEETTWWNISELLWDPDHGHRSGPAGRGHLHQPHILVDLLKFIYSEKTTKFCKISTTVDLSYVVMVS